MALHQLICYLEHNSDTCFKIEYCKGRKAGLDGFADFNWGNSASHHSMTGSMAQCKVLVHSKMQKAVSLSAAVAEDYAASELAIKVLYLCNLLE